MEQGAESGAAVAAAAASDEILCPSANAKHNAMKKGDFTSVAVSPLVHRGTSGEPNVASAPDQSAGSGSFSFGNQLKIDIPAADPVLTSSISGKASMASCYGTSASLASSLGRPSMNFLHADDPFSPSADPNLLEPEVESETQGNDMQDDQDPAPEKGITLVLVRLAVLEKAASMIGKLAFAWATIVLLGPYSDVESPLDFRLIAMLLCTEGTRIFSRAHELKWQHAAARSSLSIYKLPKWLKRASSSVMQVGSDIVYESRRFAKNVVSDLSFQRTAANLATCVTSYNNENDHHHQRDERFCKPTQNVSLIPYTGDGTSSSKMFTRPIFISKRAIRIGNATRMPSVARKWSMSMAPIVPLVSYFSAQTVSRLLRYLQILSALLSVAVSVWRLCALPSFHPLHPSPNVKLSLYLFYSMSFMEGSIFLLEKIYWNYKITYGKLLENVRNYLTAGLTEEEHQDHTNILESFFYEVYSKNLNGSAFDGLDLDLVAYSLGLLQSDDAKAVLNGTRVLRALTYHQSAAVRNDAFRRIGITIGAMDRLVEMLAWRNPHEIEIRKHAAAIVKHLVHFTRNCSRVMAIVGSLDNIVSLLRFDDEDLTTYCPTINDADWTICPSEIVELQNYGLKILKCLAMDHSLCYKIGETQDLLNILVDLIEVRYRTQIPNDPKSPYRKTIKNSLQLLQLLSGATGRSGKLLRPLITNVVSTIPHVRDILEHREKFGELQRFAVDILTNLALDETSRGTIGSTGGVLKNLMALLVQQGMPSHSNIGYERSTPSKIAKAEEIVVATKAGKALTLLALRNPKNCERILKLNFAHGDTNSLGTLMELLRNEEVGTSAARILSFIFTYTNSENEAQICKAIEFLLTKLLKTSDMEAQEAIIGLVAKAISTLSTNDFEKIWTNKDIPREDVVKLLLDILKHAPTTTRSPCRRRYAIQLVIVLLERDEGFVSLFINAHLGDELNETLQNISDVENFLLFSGGAGLVPHSEEMEDLIEKALQIFNSSMSHK